MAETDNRRIAPSQRRLQREPDFTGAKLSSFREVALRHGLPGALLALACLALPQSLTLLQEGLSQAAENPERFMVAGVIIFAVLNLYTWFIDRA